MSCKICHKTCVSEDDFDSDAKPHVCTICGYSFSLKIQLKRHTQSHANGDPFVCIYCSKDSDKKKSKSYNLRLAKQGDHFCEDCGQSFNSKRMLLKHTDLEHRFESAFMCDDCDEVFASSNELRKHSFTHKYKTVSKKRSLRKEDSVSPVSKSLQCPECFKSFTYQASLDKHIRQCKSESSEDETPPLKPAKRKKAVPDDKPSKKPKTYKATNNKHECDVCGKSFKRKSALEGHEMIHAQDEFDSAGDNFSEDEYEEYVPEIEPKINIIKQSFMCKKCNFVCFSKASLNKHIDRNHADKDETENSDKGSHLARDDDEPKSKQERKTFICDFCKKQFKTEKRFKKHLLAHDPCLSLSEESSHSVSDEDESKSKQEGKTYKCDFCDKKYKNENLFKKHMLTHDPCLNLEGSSQSVSDEDESKSKPEGKTFTCDFCEKKYKNEKSFKKHLLIHDPSLKHSEENSDLVGDDDESKSKQERKPFKCDFCERQFKSKKRFKKHLRVHDPNLSDEEDIDEQSKSKKKRNKDFVCDICGKQFAGETCLKKHSLRHEDGTIEIKRGRKKKEKPIDIFTCDFCNEEFVGKKGAYVKHLNTHTPEVCGICEERFIDRQSLREHCKIHVGTDEGKMFMECSQKALDAKNGILPPEPKVEYIYLVLR